MKNISLFIGILFLFMQPAFGQNMDNPWNADQLMEPVQLANMIKAKTVNNTLILSIGFDAPIKHSVEIGPATRDEGIKNLKSYLKDVPKDQPIVIYCGCCPMEKCPNIRPAFKLLEQLGYTNVKLLDLKTSVKADWIDKGFQVKEKSDKKG